MRTRTILAAVALIVLVTAGAQANVSLYGGYSFGTSPYTDAGWIGASVQLAPRIAAHVDVSLEYTHLDIDVRAHYQVVATADTVVGLGAGILLHDNTELYYQLSGDAWFDLGQRLFLSGSASYVFGAELLWEVGIGYEVTPAFWVKLGYNHFRPTMNGGFTLSTGVALF